MTGKRVVGLDAARGVAVISMFFAHFAPGTGPGSVITLSEHLTAFLFVLLIGCGAELGRASAHRWRSTQVRASALVVIGVLLMQPTSQIAVVLVWLGVMTVIALWLTHLPTWAVAAVAAASVAFEPALVTWSRTWLVEQPRDSITTAVVDVLFADGSYRVAAFLLPAAVGVLLVRLVGTSSQRLALAGASSGVAAVLFALDKSGTALLVPYSGDRQELVFNTALCLVVTCLAWVLAPRAAVVGTALAAVGSMALTLYAAQIVGDWAFTESTGRTDDSWAVLAVACVGAVAAALAWLPVHRASGWRGPLEGPIDLLARGSRSGVPRVTASS